MISTWFEVWVDNGLSVPYVLLVMPDSEQQDIAVIDPKEDNKVVFRSGDYDTVKFWLLEDEYSLVIGRTDSE